MSTNADDGARLSSAVVTPARTRHLITLVLTMSIAASATAQERDHRSLVSDVIRGVVFDPTTYAPAIVAWKTTRLDWQSSQPFFENGWSENNPRYTVSGRAGDTPIGYAAGNRQILMDAIGNLQISLLNNVSARVTERLLVSRYPNHRKLLGTVGWIERSAMASYLTYWMSADHFRQWQENERRAQQLGYH